jgi:hypothetical protein
LEESTEPADQSTNNDPGESTEPVDQSTNNDPGEAAEPADQSTNDDSVEGSEPTEDLSTDSGIEVDNLNEENSEEDNGDLLDLFDPDNIVDPEDLLDLFAPDTITDEIEADLEEELEPDKNQKKPEEYGTWAFSVMDEEDLSVGSGYYTRTEGEPDELEFYISLSSITQQYDGITEMSMVIKKLGKQEIFCVGASTSPFIGIAVGAGIAILSMGAYTYRKRVKC